eukprot:EG_transcript_15971
MTPAALTPAVLAVGVAGLLGAVGSLAYLVTYLLFHGGNTQTRRLVFQLALCDLLQAAFCVLSVAPFNDPTNPRDCLRFGLPLHFALLASAVWTAAVALFTHRVVSHPGELVDEWTVALFELSSWGLAILTVGTTFIYVSTLGNDPSYMAGGVCLSPAHPCTAPDAPALWALYRLPLLGCGAVVWWQYAAAREKAQHIEWTLKSLTGGSSAGEPPRDLHGVAFKFRCLPLVFLLTRGGSTALAFVCGPLGQADRLMGWQREAEAAVLALEAAQGLFNGLAFVLFTRHVRRRCCGCAGRRLQERADLLPPLRRGRDPLNAGGSSQATKPFTDAAALSEFRV